MKTNETTRSFSAKVVYASILNISRIDALVMVAAL